jgi:hypothetical protein
MRQMESDTRLVVWMNKPDNIIIGVPQSLITEYGSSASLDDYGIRLYTGQEIKSGLKR